MQTVLRIEQLRPGLVPERVAEWRGSGAQIELAFVPEFGALNRLFLFGDDASGRWVQRDGGAADAEPPRILHLQHHHGDGAARPDERLFELRTYTLLPGRLDEFLATMLAAMTGRERHSRNLGIWSHRAAEGDAVLHMWPYRDLAQRDAARLAVNREASWQAYGRFAHSVLAAMQAELLVRAPED